MEDTTQGAGGTITKPLCIPDQCIDGTVTPITLHLPKDLGNLSPEMENYLEEGLRTIFSASGLNMEHDFFVRRSAFPALVGYRNKLVANMIKLHRSSQSRPIFYGSSRQGVGRVRSQLSR